MMLRAVKQARKAFSLLGPDEIRTRAERPVHVGLVADGIAAYAEMEDFLIPASVPYPPRAQLMEQVHRASDAGVPESVDLILYEPGVPCPPGAYTFRRADTGATMSEILH